MGAVRLSSSGKLRLSGGKALLVAAGAAGAAGAATALTVNDFIADRIFQRVGTSKTVPVTGTYAGPATSIQARAVPVGTSLASTAYAWSDIAATLDAGNFSGALAVPQGGWYVLQVRDGVNSAVNAAGARKFSVGVLVALLGQSNMEKLSLLLRVYPLVDLLTRRFATNAWTFVGNFDLTGTYPPNTPISTYGSTYAYPSPNGDGVTRFVNYLRAALGVPVGTLEYAVGGSSVASWQPGGAQYVTFSAALAASGGDCEAAIYLQGEADAAANTSDATYKAGLLGLRNALHASTGRNATNFNLGIVVLGPGDGFAAVGRMGAIRKAQLEFIAQTPGVYLSSSATDGDLATDAIHFTVQSQERQGKRYALGLAGRLGASAYGAEGPHITGATRSGATVTVAIAQNGGTSLMDGAGGTTGTGLTGFRVFNDGTPVTIGSKTISGNNVVLTLASTPAGAVTLDYAMTDAPFGNPMVPAAALYDNRTVPGDSIGVPLQPCTAIIVAGA